MGSTYKLPSDAPDGTLEVLRGGIKVCYPSRPPAKGSTMRNIGLVRQWQIVMYLQTWRTIDEIAAHFGVTKRTIYRDIRTLESVPFPMRRHDTTGRWKISCSISLEARQ